MPLVKQLDWSKLQPQTVEIKKSHISPLGNATWLAGGKSGLVAITKKRKKLKATDVKIWGDSHDSLVHLRSIVNE